MPAHKQDPPRRPRATERMVAGIRREVALCLIPVLAFAAWLGARSPASPAQSLASDSAARVLERDFPDGSLSYLLIDTATKETTASRWPDAARAVPLGSLVKPFLALAYFHAHGSYPVFECRGEPDGCWLPKGHGRAGIEQAVAHSCNAYFLELARHTPATRLIDVTRALALPGPQQALPDTLIGRGSEWPIAPADGARAYVELLSRADNPGVRPILNGMAMAARGGTAAAAERPALLAKTGTAPCTHSPSAPGDGFFLCAYPAPSPRFVLLVRAHGRPGSAAAAIGARMLDDLLGTR